MSAESQNQAIGNVSKLEKRLIGASLMFYYLPDRLVAMGVTLVQWPVCGSYRSTEFRMFSPS